MRALLMLPLCSMLMACAADVSPLKPYVPPSRPTTAAANKGIAQTVAEEKITGPIQMSDLRETDHGPGRFVLCIRGVEPKYSRRTTYAVFFDNDDYKGSRMSVMIDACEKQVYRPYTGPASPAAPPSPAAVPAARHRGKHQMPF
jgi:hypothetical protein